MSEAQPQTTILTPAYTALVIGVIGISLGSIFIRLAQAEGVPSLLIAAARLSIAAFILTPIVLRRYLPDIRQLERSELVLAGVSGIFLAVHFATWVSSLEYTSVLISVVLVNTNPLWAALLEVTFLKIRLPKSVKLGLAIAFIGGVVIVLPSGGQLALGSNPLLGAGLAIVGAIAVSVYFVIGRKLRASLPLLPYIWLVYGCAAIVSMIVVLISRIPVTGYSTEAYFWLVTMAVVPQLIGHSSLNYALGYLPATFVTISIQLEPMISAVFALFLFSEIPSYLQIVSSIVILAGVILASIGQSRSASK
jgi:drug/metabolite transporter (DMT)-like permease